MTKDAYFSLLTRAKQLLLVTFCDTLAGIEVSFWADGTGRTDGRTDGWTDRRGSRNSYLDITAVFFYLSNFLSCHHISQPITFKSFLN